jgi:hypothetical protein
MSAHSTIVGGSSAGRVIACPGSVQLVRKAPPHLENAHMAQGTRLHDAIERQILEGDLKWSDFSDEEEAKIAAKARARWPRVVAAQWALESGYGKHTSGKNNFFGLKGKSSSGQLHQTKEFINGKWVTISDSFIDFESPEACINYLVERWYKDWKGYRGVNRAKSEAECCELLQLEGYATDPSYARKLLKIIEDSK